MSRGTISCQKTGLLPCACSSLGKLGAQAGGDGKPLRRVTAEFQRVGLTTFGRRQGDRQHLVADVGGNRQPIEFHFQRATLKVVGKRQFDLRSAGAKAVDEAILALTADDPGLDPGRFGAQVERLGARAPLRAASASSLTGFVAVAANSGRLLLAADAGRLPVRSVRQSSFWPSAHRATRAFPAGEEMFA